MTRGWVKVVAGREGRAGMLGSGIRSSEIEDDECRKGMMRWGWG